MKTCKKVCSECPFKKDSAKGWLGPHTIDEIMDAMQFETPFSCHMQRTDATDYADIKEGKIDVCRGFLISANNSFKLFGQSPQGKELNRLQKLVGKDDTILDRRDFREHHNIKIK